MNQKLVELLEKKQKQSRAGKQIDWNQRRDEYLAGVTALYEQIEGMLAEPIAAKTVQAIRRAKQLTESYIGTYSVEDLLLIIGSEQVRFSPRGRNIVGARGRVDVVGDRGEASLVLQDDSKWGFVYSREPKLTIMPLDEATMAEILQLVMRD